MLGCVSTRPCVFACLVLRCAFQRGCSTVAGLFLAVGRKRRTRFPPSPPPSRLLFFSGSILSSLPPLWFGYRWHVLGLFVENQTRWDLSASQPEAATRKQKKPFLMSTFFCCSFFLCRHPPGCHRELNSSGCEFQTGTGPRGTTPQLAQKTRGNYTALMGEVQQVKR